MKEVKQKQFTILYSTLPALLTVCIIYEIKRGKTFAFYEVFVSFVCLLAGIVSALDIGLSNWSFDFITVSL